MGDTYLNRKCEPEEIDLDLPPEKNIEEDHPKLMLVNMTAQPGENLLSSSIQADAERSDSAELSEEGEKELYSDSQMGAHSSLVTYLKTINRFSLLNEEEERILAKRIKESEKECKSLVVKWELIFKKEVLGKLSTARRRETSERLKLLNGTYHLFDDLTKWERERKRVNQALKRRAYLSKTKQELQKKLYKVEAEISKGIAELSLSKTGVKRMIRNLKKILHTKKNIKKQQIVEQELRTLLQEIGHIVKEMKTLKNELAQANLRLVISIAKKYVHNGLALPDLIQEGNLGLMRAIDTYDYRRGHRFIAYATWWIRQGIIRALDCQSRTIRTPVYISERLSQIVKASNQLLQEGKRKPTLEEIAEKTNSPLAAIEKVIQVFRDSASLDLSIKGKDESVNNSPLNYETISILEQAISSDLSQITDEILSDLTQREREIVKLRFGMGEEHDHTLEEIGKEFNLSKERIRQILEVALNKLRNPKYMMKLKDFKKSN